MPILELVRTLSVRGRFRASRALQVHPDRGFVGLRVRFACVGAMGYKDRTLLDRHEDIGLSTRTCRWYAGAGATRGTVDENGRLLGPTWSSLKPWWSWLCLGVIVLGTLACGRHIGDSCSSSADCDPTSGTRTCDLSQPGGYCLLEGCDARSCPGDSVCIRVFPGALLSKTCSADAPCDPDELCLPYTSGPTSSSDGGAPAVRSGSYCARTSLEKRLCLQGCGGNGDCRSGYTCIEAGTNGTIALTLTASEAASTRYCAAVR